MSAAIRHARALRVSERPPPAASVEEIGEPHRRVDVEVSRGVSRLADLHPGPGRCCFPRHVTPSLNRPISVYRFPRRALTLCPHLCMGIEPGARFPVQSANALPATLCRHFTQATCRIRPIALKKRGSEMCRMTWAAAPGRTSLDSRVPSRYTCA